MLIAMDLVGGCILKAPKRTDRKRAPKRSAFASVISPGQFVAVAGIRNEKCKFPCAHLRVRIAFVHVCILM